MSEQFISLQQAWELYEEELNAIAGGQDVNISGFTTPEDVKIVAENSPESAIKSVNKIATALHLITLNF